MGPWISVDDGWYPIIADLHTKLLEVDPDYTLYQVKEKFGSLRYYIGVEASKSAEAYALVNEAEKQAAHTCEMCGVDGATLRTERSWVKTMCDSCNGENTAGLAS